jgi:hypothetical protein
MIYAPEVRVFHLAIGAIPFDKVGIVISGFRGPEESLSDPVCCGPGMGDLCALSGIKTGSQIMRIVAADNYSH